MNKIQLIEKIFIDPAEFDRYLRMYSEDMSERAARKEVKKDLAFLKEHLTMCPVALTAYTLIAEIREALRPYGFNNLEAWAAVELAYRYMELEEEDTWLVEKGITRRLPRIKEPTIYLGPEISASVDGINPPEHIGDMRYLNPYVKDSLRKGISRVFENWQEAIDEALYSTMDSFDYGHNLYGPSYPILRYHEIQNAPLNVRLMKKYGEHTDKEIEEWLRRAKENPEDYIV